MFLAESTLRTAVERLSVARGRSRLADYLIFKRALVRTTTPNSPSNGALASDQPVPPPDFVVPTREPIQVRTGTKSAPFVYAIDEIALCVPRDHLEGWPRRVHFVPFDAKKAKAAGYKSEKWPSNGPDNTAQGWQTGKFTPVRLVPETSPREWVIESGSREDLEAFLLFPSTPSSEREKPRVLDAACWWLRFFDFETEPSEGELIGRFVDDFGLTEDEESALFAELTAEEAGSVQLAESIADSSAYLPPAPGAAKVTTAVHGGSPAGGAVSGPAEGELEAVMAYISARGFVFEPWQVAAYITAIRTKPFVILAGISGTGKTKLPRLVAEATSSQLSLIPVQPSWTDSADVIGYERLGGKYAPGHLLRAASRAQNDADSEYVVLLDELNIARVEYYLAEVLSLIEERHEESGQIISPRFVPAAPLDEAGQDWTEVRLTSNLAIVGSVNMDETTFGFSKKVLDRSFVIEFSTVDLSIVGDADPEALPAPRPWPVSWWRAPALTLAAHPERTDPVVADCISALNAVNERLAPAQLQVGYRVRDEIAMFCLHAQPYLEAFVTRDEEPIDPLDLAITMKVLPRIQGGGPTIRAVLENLNEWATARTPTFPMCAERIAIMRQRLDESGFASYWL